MPEMTTPQCRLHQLDDGRDVQCVVDPPVAGATTGYAAANPGHARKRTGRAPAAIVGRRPCTC
jgi:hypothetical protein